MDATGYGIGREAVLISRDKNAPEGAINTIPGLTRSLDLTKEGLWETIPENVPS